MHTPTAVKVKPAAVQKTAQEPLAATWFRSESTDVVRSARPERPSRPRSVQMVGGMRALRNRGRRARSPDRRSECWETFRIRPLCRPAEFQRPLKTCVGEQHAQRNASRYPASTRTLQSMHAKKTSFIRPANVSSLSRESPSVARVSSASSRRKPELACVVSVGDKARIESEFELPRDLDFLDVGMSRIDQNVALRRNHGGRHAHDASVDSIQPGVSNFLKSGRGRVLAPIARKLGRRKLGRSDTVGDVKLDRH
jgi:hypothetical protein